LLFLINTTVRIPIIPKIMYKSSKWRARVRI